MCERTHNRQHFTFQRLNNHTMNSVLEAQWLTQTGARGNIAFYMCYTHNDEQVTRFSVVSHSSIQCSCHLTGRVFIVLSLFSSATTSILVNTEIKTIHEPSMNSVFFLLNLKKKKSQNFLKTVNEIKRRKHYSYFFFDFSTGQKKNNRNI